MKKKILVADDVAINREILIEMVQDDFAVVEAADGEQALARIRESEEPFAVILLDLVMPEMDGFAVLQQLWEDGYLERTPALVISGDNSSESEQRCLAFGVADFIHKPFDEAVVKRRIANVIDLYAYKNGLEDKVAEQNRILSEHNRELAAQAERLEKFNRTIIELLGTVVESRSLESGEHIQRVQGYTRILAEQMMQDHPKYGLTPHIIDVMVLSSALHDVGKIAIPDSVLLKPGKLTPEEFDEMKLHTIRGCEMISTVKGAWDEEYQQMSYDICRSHHERFDGRGYPDHLAGDDIPIHAQIVSVADVYDALTSKRVYKDAYDLDTAYRTIMEGRCGAFSPELLESLTNAKEKLEQLHG